MADGDLKRKTISGFFWRFGERISSQLVSFAVSVVLARLLLPQEYGTIALCMVFINLTAVLAVSGLGTSLVQKKDADGLDFSTMFHAGMAVSLLLYAALFVSAPWVAALYGDPQVCAVLRVLGLVIPVQALNSVQQASVSRTMDFRKFFYATGVGTVVSGAVGIAMACAGCGVWALVGQQLSNNIVNTFTLNRIIDWRPDLRFSFRRCRRLLSFGARLMGANFLGTFFNELKNFIVGFRYTPADLAFYNRGDSLPGLFSNNVNNTINAVLFPAISKVQDDRSAVKRAVRRSMMTGSFVVFPLLFMLAAAADNIVLVLLTDKWLPCVPYIRVLCVGHCMGVLGTANLQAINAVGRSDVTLKLELYKKPLYILAIFAGMCVSPLAIAVAHTFYSLLGTAINAWPNKRLIGYKFSEQLQDVAPQFALALVAALAVYSIGLAGLNVWLALCLQFLAGVGLYWGGSRMFSLECYRYVCSSVQAFFAGRHKS